MDSFEVCAYSWCRKQPADILDHDPVGLQCVDRCRHMCPEAGTGAGLQTGHLPDGRYVLAGKPATEDVHWRHGFPVDGGDITKVRGLGPVVGEDAGDGLVDLGEPDRSGIEDFFDSEIESAVAGEQRPDTQQSDPVGECLVGHG